MAAQVPPIATPIATALLDTECTQSVLPTTMGHAQGVCALDDLCISVYIYIYMCVCFVCLCVVTHTTRCICYLCVIYGSFFDLQITYLSINMQLETSSM